MSKEILLNKAANSVFVGFLENVLITALRPMIMCNLLTIENGQFQINKPFQ